MHRVISLAVGALLLVAVSSLAQTPDLVARGKYLVEVAANCGECHTPATATGEPDERLHLAGHVTGTPVPSNTSFKDFHTGAVTYARNLTPDRETGLGSWTREEFYRALKEGIGKGGRPLRAPMPWERFRKMLSDQDVEAIWAYLRSLPPVENQVPEPPPR